MEEEEEDGGGWKNVEESRCLDLIDVGKKRKKKMVGWKRDDQRTLFFLFDSRFINKSNK